MEFTHPPPISEDTVQNDGVRERNYKEEGSADGCANDPAHGPNAVDSVVD